MLKLYIGIFDDLARALDFDEKAVQQVVSNIDELRKAVPLQVQMCLAFFSGVDRTVGGYEGLLAAQQCLPNNEVRDKFAAVGAPRTLCSEQSGRPSPLIARR